MSTSALISLLKEYCQRSQGEIVRVSDLPAAINVQCFTENETEIIRATYTCEKSQEIPLNKKAYFNCFIQLVLDRYNV